MLKNTKTYCNTVYAHWYSAGLLFKSTFRLSNRAPKITQILKITPHTAWRHSVKKTKFRPKAYMNVKFTALCSL